VKTERLIWQMSWQGSVWGSLAGAILGGSYVALCTFILFFMLRFPVASSTPTTGLTFQIGIVIGVLLVALIGAVINGLLGLILGLAGGALCGMMTRLFFFPSKHERGYGWVVGVSSALYGLIGTLVGVVGVLMFIASLTHPATSTATRSGMASYTGFILMTIFVVPPLIGSLVAILIGQHLAGLYRRTTGTVAAHESRAATGSVPVPSGAS
jgi:hypothetical protein